ncbi:unnamed protein product [Rotaria socialis]
MLPSKRQKTRSYETTALAVSQLELDWLVTHKNGVGLINTNSQNKCLNICYMNSIIQCFAYIAPFVQWLLSNNMHSIFTLTADGEFCSFYVLRSIRKDIHNKNIENNCDLFSSSSQASAVSMARNIQKISSSFTPGRQENPSEFLICLFTHVNKRLSSNNSSSYVTHALSSIHIIFGVNLESSIKCTMCMNEASKQNYESVWFISMVSHRAPRDDQNYVPSRSIFSFTFPSQGGTGFIPRPAELCLIPSTCLLTL